MKGQRWVFHQYSIQDGLPNSNVFCVYQDQKGLIWLGTDHGLASFDGDRFAKIAPEDGLLGPHITGIVENHHGDLLAGSYRRGMNIIRDERLIQPDSAKQICPFGYDLVAKGEHIFFSTVSSLFVCSPREKEEIGLRDAVHQLSGRNVDPYFSFHVNIAPRVRDSSLLVGCMGGLYTYKDEQLSSFCDSLFWDLPVYSVFEHPSGDLWIGSLGKLIQVRDCRVVATYTEGLPADRWIHRILQDQKGNVWVSVNGYGLCQLDQKSSRLVFLGEKLNIGHTDINHLMEDEEGNIWLATKGQGVIMISYSDFLFFGASEGLNGGKITAIESSPQGDLFVGTPNGLFKKQGDQFERIRLFDLPGDAYVFDLEYVEELGLVVSARTSSAIKGSNVKKISEEIVLIQSYTSLALGSEYLLYPSTDYARPITVAQIEDRFVKEIHQIAFPPTEKEQPYRVQSLFADDSDRIWIATRSHGLWMLPHLDTDVSGAETDSIVPPSIRQRSIHDFLSVSDSLYWMATENGLGKWESESWKFFDISDGLGDNYCSSLLLDESGGLWIGTARGLSYFQEGEFITMGPEEGLATPDVHALFLDKRQNGMWVGTGNGLYFLPLDASPAHQIYELKTEIIHVASNDSVYRNPRNLVLDEDESDLEIGYRSLFYRNPDQLVYQYRFANRDQQWKTTKRPQIEYASLADGDYHFEVRASMKQGQWSEAASLHFRIRSPFWKTIWFYLLIALTLVGLVLLLARQRIREIRQGEAEKRTLMNQIYALEQKALAAMMNPHFIFNSLNSIQHYLNFHDKEAANEYLAKFARLVRMNMEVAQHALTPLDEELYRIQLYLSLEKLRFGDQFEFDIQLDPEVDAEEIDLPSMIIQPFVENAIWHGILPANRPGNIQIRVACPSDQILRITVEDNGVGIGHKSEEGHENSSHISRGMEITRERLQLFSPQSQLIVEPIVDEAEQAAGTRIEIIIPIVSI